MGAFVSKCVVSKCRENVKRSLGEGNATRLNARRQAHPAPQSSQAPQRGVCQRVPTHPPVTAWYSARPISWRKECSGPTPG